MPASLKVLKKKFSFPFHQAIYTAATFTYTFAHKRANQMDIFKIKISILLHTFL